MHDIYYFNGQDITMNVCIKFIELLILFRNKKKIDFEEAVGNFIVFKRIKHLLKLKMAYGQKMLNIF